jgi:hypothetical protein
MVPIGSTRKPMSVPFDINVITAQVNPTIGVGEAASGHASGTPLKIKRWE